MENKIKRTAKSVTKYLQKDISIERIIEYIKLCGYSTVFFNTYDGNKELDRYGLDHLAEKLTAFTYAKTARIVFIDDNKHIQDKLYLLLHELGHILLKHIGDEKMSLRNPILMDIEADAFAYELISKM